MNELLIEYAAGALPPAQRDEVARHLAGCGACRVELAGWAAMAGPVAPPPGKQAVAQALLRSAMAPSAPLVVAGPRWRMPLALVRAQARLVPVSLWIAAVLVMVLGVVVAGHGTQTSAGTVMALVAPIVAALCVVVVSGPDRDPALEVCSATLTGPRLPLLARVTLVFGYDLALAVAGSAMLWLFGVRAEGLLGLIGAWFGPTALLSSLALLAAVVIGTELAAAAAASLWALRLAAGAGFGATGWLAPLRDAWVTSPATVVVAAVALLAAGLFAGRGEPVRRRRPTYLS
ncbi:MAG TPA: zf-HC2 domain-containing protein [Rugosimonospora sp.]